MRILKQSTEVIVPIGPMVDASDGATLESAISFTSGEVALIKHQGASVVNIGGNTYSAHLGGGMYNLTLTASNTDTIGLLSVVAYDAAARPVRQDFMVVPANVYDSIVNGTDKLEVDAVQISSSTAAADSLEETTKPVVTGTVQSGSTTTVITTNLTETQNDHYNGRTILFTSGTQNRVAAEIKDYSGASKQLTVSALPAAPSNGDQFVIV